MPEVFPRKLADVTNDWLSGVLGARVTGFRTGVFEGSNLSEVCRLHTITYGGDRRGPSSVIVKFAHHAKPIREIAAAGNLYTKEVKFFAELAVRVPITTPMVYGCFTDGSPTSEFFVIVMEDITTHSKVFDQIDDPPDEAFARRIADEAASLHAAFWESDVTRLPWVGREDGRYLPPLYFVSAEVRQSWPAFRALWRQMYGVDFLAADDAPLEELAALLCGPQSLGIHDRIYNILSSRPKTLLHGDLRADNIFRADPTANTPVADATLTYIDFQLVHAGPPGPEFTEAWVHSLEPDVRRRDKEMLRQYHETLVSLNPDAAAYTYDMLLEDYALAACFWWTLLITFGVQTLQEFHKPEEARQKRLWEKMLYRHNIALRDLDCLARIKELAAGLLDDP